ncbi:MAG TPA: tagaturonate reductase [Lunatimonas sp.]|nr:tagaturonate reductase [Lunatimonas sp.]
MKSLNRKSAEISEKHPSKVIQFGTGNFLRGFADWIFDLMNEKSGFAGSVQLVQVHGKKPATSLLEQDGLYTLLTRGFQNGQTIDESRLITCIADTVNPYLEYDAFLKLAELPELEWIISNTTEAGIFVDSTDSDYTQTPNSFPGKLTALLFNRFEFVKDKPSKTIHVLPCELIEQNGKKLKEAVLEYAKLWQLPADFNVWLEAEVKFYNTLVDRIVPGFPTDEAEAIQEKLGYKDDLMVVAEPFHFWAIEGPDSLKSLFPASSLGLDVIIVRDLQPYRTRKVRILNGAHTTLVPVAYLKGLRFVGDAMNDPEVSEYLQSVLRDEIIPSIDLPKEELEKFAEAVLDRFRNPFVKHQLSAIALNSISKFQVRVLPSILEYIKKENKLPVLLLKSLAALLVFYRGYYKGVGIPVNDTADVMAFFNETWKVGDPYEVVPSILANTGMWGQDLNQYPGFSDRVIQEVIDLLDQEKIVQA